MTLYHFNVRQEDRYTADEEGEVLEQGDLPARANDMALDMLRGRSTMTDYRSCAFEITDDTGLVVHRLRFEDAVALAPG